MSAKPDSPAPVTPEVVAAVHWQGDRWRLVVLANRNGLNLVQAVSLDADGQIAPILAQYKVERLMRVAPSRETVAKCAAIPAGSPEELGPALALLAEAHLPESIAPHRRTAGGLPEADGSSPRSALLVGWKGEAPAQLADDMVEETWTTPLAALAVLRNGRGHSAVYADPDEGAISVLVVGSKSMARVLVEDAANPSAFARAVGAVVTETCSAAGISAPMTNLGESGIVLSIDSGVIGAARGAVTGVPDQRSWFEQFGLALGAAMMALSKDPLVRTLGAIKAAAPIKRESVPERAVAWVSRKRNAWGLLAASVAILLLGPWVVASARLAILESKAVGLGDRNKERAEAARKAALYRQLEVSRWPMSKLMAEVSAAIPMGVTTESIRLASDQGLAIQGSAETPELVNTMQANLNATRLLGNLKLNRVESGGSGVEFDLTADVVSPHAKATGLEDYASKPLAVRLYGPEGSNTAMPKNVTTARESAVSREPRAASRASERPERSERAERNNGGGERSGGGGERGGDRGSSRSSEAPARPAAAPPGEAPAPLTDDQIAKMDRATATKEWVSRKTFPQKNPTIEPAIKSRLDEEVRKLREQMDKAGAAK